MNGWNATGNKKNSTNQSPSLSGLIATNNSACVMLWHDALLFHPFISQPTCNLTSAFSLTATKETEERVSGKGYGETRVMQGTAREPSQYAERVLACCSIL